MTPSRQIARSLLAEESFRQREIVRARNETQMKLRRAQVRYELRNPPCGTLQSHLATKKPTQFLLLRTFVSPSINFLFVGDALIRKRGTALCLALRYVLLIWLLSFCSSFFKVSCFIILQCLVLRPSFATSSLTTRSQPRSHCG